MVFAPFGTRVRSRQSASEIVRLMIVCFGAWFRWPVGGAVRTCGGVASGAGCAGWWGVARRAGACRGGADGARVAAWSCSWLPLGREGTDTDSLSIVD